MTYEEEYLNLIKHILEEGVSIKNDRTGRECLTIPEYTFEYSEHDIPLLTTRPSYPVSALAEILGYLRRYEWADQFDNIGAKTWYVNANQTEAWLENPNRLGENHIGKCYGAALEEYEIKDLLLKLNNGIDDRGLILNFWKPEMFELGCLRPCMYQHVFSIIGDTLYLNSYQRSCDVMCGLNFNSLQVWFLLKLICEITGLKFGKAKHHIVNVHIYDKHLEGVSELLTRKTQELDVGFEIEPWVYGYRTLNTLLEDEHAREYFTLKGYEPQSRIDFELIA